MNLDDAPRVLITGATGGLGAATARELSGRGWHVIVGGRSRDRVRGLVDKLNREGTGGASSFVADLADLDAVRRAARGVDGPLHGVVANAGVTLRGEHLSAQGYELTFAVNVLAHQLLLALLHDRLDPIGRVVVVSSGTHLPGHPIARLFRVPPPRWVGPQALARPEHPDHLEPGPLRYSTSKLGSVLLARGLQARMGPEQRAVAIDPGLMAGTELAREAPALVRRMLAVVGGALTHVVDGFRHPHTSAGHVADLLTGRIPPPFAYFDGDTLRAPSSDAQRGDLAEQVWVEGARLVGLTQDETPLALS